MLKGVLLAISVLWTCSVFSASLVDNFLRGHEREVQTSAFSLNGKMLASGSSDHNVILWNLETKEQITVLKAHTSTVYAVAFSKISEHLLASGSSNGHIALWDTQRGVPLANLSRAGEFSGVLSMEFSPIEDLLAVSFIDGSIRVWDVKTMQIVAHTIGHMGGFVLSVHFLPDGQSIISTGGQDNRVKIWNKKLEQIEEFGFSIRGSAPLWDSAVSSDGKTIVASCSDGSIKVWRKGQSQLSEEIYVHSYLTIGLAFSPDDSELFIGTAGRQNSEEGNYVLSLDLNLKQAKIRWDGHRNRIRDLTLSPDGKSLASASWDGSIGLWALD